MDFIDNLVLKIILVTAYDRHVEWCKEKSLIKPNPDPRTVSIAKERLKTRVGYKAPNLK